ncbi:hypothetical protein [Azohydromonas caseinilytica]|uniref:Signal recognition particle subunit FFH/SRP54 (Srp54) n=1 Tax=Azohydromonas caseinilytica TaxID=2728836 RepID=A0A848FKM5_9BURK|nr:hypothetical protein [Azohydromonas caseinilytica]NML18351.1 hypothetical protein [Azohydromonas caseinilytica]
MALRPLAFTTIMAALSLGACAQLKPDEHAEHHPEGASAPAATTPAATPMPPPAASAVPMGNMEQHMKAMREMHEKMARARTPQEREALMAEHMKLMQDGMAMMGGMGPSGGMGGMNAPRGAASAPATPAARMQMLEQRMDMMQSMMQMMMDRLPATPAPSPAKP